MGSTVRSGTVSVCMHYSNKSSGLKCKHEQPAPGHHCRHFCTEQSTPNTEAQHALNRTWGQSWLNNSRSTVVRWCKRSAPCTCLDGQTPLHLTMLTGVSSSHLIPFQVLNQSTFNIKQCIQWSQNGTTLLQEWPCRLSLYECLWREIFLSDQYRCIWSKA